MIMQHLHNNVALLRGNFVAFQERIMEIQGWTAAEESAFHQIMAASDLERLPAIRLYRHCNDNLAKALHIAKDYYGLSDSQWAAYQQSKAARVAGLVKARAARRLNRSIQQTERAA
jgi:hypothetical protein